MHKTASESLPTPSVCYIYKIERKQTDSVWGSPQIPKRILCKCYSSQVTQTIQKQNRLTDALMEREARSDSKFAVLLPRKGDQSVYIKYKHYRRNDIKEHLHPGLDLKSLT